MTPCLLCGHDENRHRNLLSQCDCGCRATKFGNTPHGVSRIEYDQLLDVVKWVASRITAARADADAVKLLPAAAAARVTGAALDGLADTLSAALDALSAAATAGTYSDGTRVVERVYDPEGGVNVEQIKAPPGVAR